MDCDIIENGTGVALGPISFGQPMPVIENNRICFSTLYNIDNRTDLNVFIPTNCFCITDSTLIEDKILDGYDDITKGLVSYAIFDTSCSTVLIYVNKSGLTGIEEGEDSEVSVIFPNPFKESLNIINSQSYISYRIFTLQGQVLKIGSLIEGENNLDVSALSAGTYLLGLYDADQRSFFRKIVRH